MKLCVVGGTGHISTTLVQVLVAQGHAVTCFNRGQRASVPPGVRLIQGDRQARQLFERTMRAERFDAAIDMLCFTQADAVSSVRAFPDVQHFVQCSTVCTYGLEDEELPVTEEQVVSQILRDDEGNPHQLLLVTQPVSRIVPLAFDTPLLRSPTAPCRWHA